MCGIISILINDEIICQAGYDNARHRKVILAEWTVTHGLNERDHIISITPFL